MRKPRPRYLPVADATPGMVLGAPIKLLAQGKLVYTLPAGHALTEDNLRQLAVRGAEFIFTEEEDRRSDDQVAVDTAAAAHRVMEIFAGADLADPLLARLFDQVLLHRSA